MKLKFKLSIIVGLIVAGSLALSAFLSINHASKIAISLSVRSIEHLAEAETNLWKGWTDSQIRILRTLAEAMEDYEDIPAETRRSVFNAMMYGVSTSNPAMINLYTVWKPNAIDGMDSRFTGQNNSGPGGQYAMAYTRETGQILSRATIDIENSMSYLTGSNSKKDRIEQPFFRKLADGREVYLIRIMVPIINHRTNETVGGVGCLLDVNVIQQEVLQTLEKQKEISSMTVFSNNGFILGDMQNERMGKMLEDVETIFGDHIDSASQAVQNGTGYKLNTFSPVLNTDVELVIVPFTLGNSNMTWSVMVVAKEDHILKDVRVMTAYIIIMIVLTIIAALAIIYFVIQRVTKPVVAVSETLKDIAEGEGDLTHEIIIRSKDEVGDLAKYFNETLEKIKNLVINIKNETVKLASTSIDLSSNMNQTAAAVNSITTNIKGIRSRMLSQSASVTETHATMENVTATINKLNKHIESQSSNVSKTSSAIEQMLANSRSVTETLIKNSSNVKMLNEAAEVGRNGLNKVAEDIREIARESEGLLQINSVIRNIASQTNLLSMNAAIEAAHAGEAGKGFGVVADEIRKLAENSGQQSKTISLVLKNIKDSIDKITEEANNVISNFGAIDSSVKTVAEQEEIIRSAMEEQGAGSKMILEGVSGMNEVTIGVKDISQEMLEGAREVIVESESLEKITHDMSGSIAEMTTGAEEINLSVNFVNDITEITRENVEILMREVSRFKVD
ncbi:MAG: methyl-accepting chemotaxis protein [Treponema sp.]|jgi:methyl-accepting chemotaxis protein|nr:methyl-accepting chemotaxis protein [Treponema sp.]